MSVHNVNSPHPEDDDAPPTVMSEGVRAIVNKVLAGNIAEEIPKSNAQQLHPVAEVVELDAEGTASSPYSISKGVRLMILVVGLAAVIYGWKRLIDYADTLDEQQSNTQLEGKSTGSLH